MRKFIDHTSMISEKKPRKYPFVIANSDSSGKGGTLWQSVLDIEPKTAIFFFDLFGLYGLKAFIIQDDKRLFKQFSLGQNR